MIGQIMNPYNAYNPYTSYTSPYREPTANAAEAAAGSAPGSDETPENGRVVIRNPGESTEKQAGRKSSPA